MSDTQTSIRLSIKQLKLELMQKQGKRQHLLKSLELTNKDIIRLEDKILVLSELSAKME